MPKKRFEAVLGGDTGDRPTVELPFDVRATFGSARPKLKVTVNGVELRTTVAIYDSRSYVGFRKEIRDAAGGIEQGDAVEVDIERDDAPREVEVPEALASALAADPEASAVFEGLAFTHRTEYATWIADAKKDETRERRVRRALEMLRGGVKHP
jgi:hypothetical protein